MTDITHIALSDLLPWSGNVRKTGAQEGLEELMASITHHGLLQPLVVKSAPDKGKTKGKYHVVAGQRRLMAMNGIGLPSDHPVPCTVIAGNADAEEISLAENAVRLQMHPIDQFHAFATLADKGTPVMDIAARFGVSESNVQKLLKLARVSPRILAAYRDGDLTLAHVQAFASTDDTARQEQVFDDFNPDYNDADDIRAELMPEGDIPATDKRAVYVSIDSYVKAGGKTRGDLFTGHTFLLDANLLNDLAEKKLSKQRKKIEAEGWAWVEIDPDLPWETRNKYGRIYEEAILTPEEQAEHAALEKELREAYASPGEDETLDERLARIEERISELEDTNIGFRPEHIAVAGAIITIDRNGQVEIERGMVRPEDKPRLKALEQAKADGDSEAVQAAIDTPAEPKVKTISASLIETLTDHRSAALKAALAVNPDIGLAAAVHAIAVGIFYNSGTGESCLNSFASRKYHRLAKETVANDELDREQLSWRDRIPGDETMFWQWCLGQDRDTLIALLTYCTALSIDATQRKADKPDCARIRHAHMLAAALKLDMSLYFRPDADNYFGKISKDMILADIRDITGKESSPAQQKMKKSELAALAARLVNGTGWLPPLLRTSESDQPRAKRNRAA